MKKIKKILHIFLSVSLFVVILFGLKNATAVTKTIRTKYNFDDYIKKNDLVVVLFYSSTDTKDQRRNLRKTKKAFKDASSTSPYRYAGVRFLLVDASRKDLSGIPNEYGVFPASDSPSIALFQGGNLAAKNRGHLSKFDVVKFIDENFGSEIEKIVEKKDKQLVRDKERARRDAYDRSYRYPYLGYSYWGYPSWGYGWPWWRSHWGFGWRSPYRWGHWGRGYRGCLRCR